MSAYQQCELLVKSISPVGKGGSRPLSWSGELYKADRREDAVRLGPQHLHQGRLKFTQANNENRKPAVVDMLLHPDLAAVLEATETRLDMFLVTDQGKPFTPAGFGNKFHDWCNQAGLPHRSAHGLRRPCGVGDTGASSGRI